MKKLNINNRIIFAMLIILVWGIISAIVEGIYWKKDVGDVKAYNEYVAQYEGTVSKEMLNGDLINNGTIDEYASNKERIVYAFNEKYRIATYMNHIWNDIENDTYYKGKTSSQLNQLCDKLKNQSKSYTYQSAIKNLEMLQQVDEPRYYNSVALDAIYEYVTTIKGSLSILLVILLAIAPIFSEENVYGMERIILSTKNGKAKIVKAKLVAGLVISVIWVTLFYFINIVVRLLVYKEFNIWQQPLNCLSGYVVSPYNWTAIQALLRCYIGAIVSSFVITIFLCVISVLQKNSIGSFIGGAAFIVLPIIIASNEGIGRVMRLFPSILIQGSELYKMYSAYNVMGKPVLYPNIAFFVNVVMGLIGIILVHKIFYNKTIA